MPLDPTQIVATIRSVVGDAPSVALHEPQFAGREWDYVKECIDTGWVSSAGSFVTAFERKLAQTCGVAHAVAMVNGTAALQLALKGVGVKPGDEVIVPALTFVASANAVSHVGATPHLADSEMLTLGIDAQKLDAHLSETCDAGEDGPVNRHTGRRVAAVVPMHVFGHPVAMSELVDVASRHRLTIVEDAAESLGSTYKGRPAGSLGRIAALSFNGNKIVTTGGGGAVLTDDEELAGTIRHWSTTAKQPHRWAFIHDCIGYNYRMPNLNAALGYAQLERLDESVAAKRRLAQSYRDAFEAVPGLRVFCEAPQTRANYWLNTLLLDPSEAAGRDAVLAATNDAGLMTRPAWTLMHHLPMYADCPRMDLSVAEDLVCRIINIPSSAGLAGD